MQRNANPQQVSIQSQVMPEFLTAKDLEALLKIDAKTIYSCVRMGLIPYVRIQRNVRFSKREILEWVEEHSYRLPQGRNR